MNKSENQNILIKKITITFVLLFFIFLSYSSWLDSSAESYTEQGIKRTLITYAVSRSLNGVISVAQGTEVAVSPAGVGLTFAPGQILDPINDLIERFSSIVLISGSSLGIQRLFLEMTSSIVVTLGLTIFVSIYLVITWLKEFKNINNANWLTYARKSMVLLLFVRFSVPLIAVVNEGLYIVFLEPQYEQAQKQLENTTDQIRLINDTTREDIELKEDDKNVLSIVERWLDKTQQSLDIETQMESLKQAAADVSQQVINMIVVFVVQTIIFPLLFLWLLIRTAKLITVQFKL